jgi:UPF0271 protein
MYTMAATNEAMSTAIVEAIGATMDTPLIYAQPGSVTANVAGVAGIAVAHEVFADRAYLADGQLAPRSFPNAVLHDVEEIAERAIRMIRGETFATVDGEPIQLQADTICVHGDTAESVHIAQTLRESLTAAGFTISPP